MLESFLITVKIIQVLRHTRAVAELVRCLLFTVCRPAKIKTEEMVASMLVFLVFVFFLGGVVWCVLIPHQVFIAILFGGFFFF